jgi:ankyrin repeat protein
MESWQLLFESIRSGDGKTFAEVLNADPQAAMARNDQGVSAILMAAYCRRWEMVGAILERGIPLDIWEAAATGKIARVRELVGRVPPLIDAVSPDGFSPLGLAAFFGQEETVDFLLEEGADLNAHSRNTMGVTPLHSAVAAQNARIVSALLDADADVDPVQQGGFTPLHGAAFAGNAEIIGLLLRAGADPLARTDEGKTPLAIAEEHNHREAADLLRNPGEARRRRPGGA